MKVLLTAAECAPFAKVGGLADVIGSLPKALKKLGVDVRVVIPRYKEISKLKAQNSKLIAKLKTKFGDDEEVGVYESKLPDSQVPIYFLENEKYLSGGGIYFSRSGMMPRSEMREPKVRPFSKDAFVSSQEEIERFAFFSKAVVGFIEAGDFKPDVVHANDWHTGMVSGLLKLEAGRWKLEKRLETGSRASSQASSIQRPASVFTIHNLANQGFAELSILKNLDSVTAESKLIKWDAQDDNLDFMLQGITGADVVSTVSPTYAKEILTPQFGEGLHQVLKAREARLFGILNGIDYEVWNPATDPLLEFNYDLLKSLDEGLSKKLGNKLHLQKHLHLAVNEKVPLVGMINRLTDQKGLDIVIEALDDILSLGPQVVILGVGDQRYEKELTARRSTLAAGHNFAFINRFDEQLAHRIYAGADLFLMPSKFEPCGLVQLIAMRYGALPIVRETGGLKDTVKDGQTGFVFREYSPQALLEAVERALSCCGLDAPDFKPMVKNAAAKDFSWEARAREYLQLYQKALKYQEEAEKISQ